MGVITITAAINKLRPATCNEPIGCELPQGGQLSVLFIGLGLIAIGAGGIRPCNIAFGADQFDTRTKKGKAQLESFFNWWYFLFTIALLIALTGVVYIQTNISWVIGFAIPTACLAFSVFFCLVGYPTYICKKPQGSVFIDMAKVISATIRKRSVKLAPAERCSFYNPNPNSDSDEEIEMEEGEINKKKKTVLTKRFPCFNRAAVITNPKEEIDEQGKPKNSWRLCTLEQVEQMKCLVGIIPVWFSGIGCLLVMDQQGTFGILQAIQMDKSIGKHFQIPPAWMGMTSMVALSIWIFIYEQIYLPLSKKYLKREKRLTMGQRIQIGIIMSLLCMLTAGIVEKKRRETALKSGSFISPLHVTYLLPQFALSGLTEAFAAVAIMEFFTLRMPESMRSVAGAVFFLSLSIASYTSSLLVNIIHSATGGGSNKGKGTPWIGGHDLNQDRLDYYYYLIAIIALINFIYFVLFSRKYVSSGKLKPNAPMPPLPTMPMAE